MSEFELIFSQKNTNLLFLDYETGGLNGRLDNGELGMCHYPIFEVAAIITDSDLNEVGDPLHIVIHQPESEIDKCDEYARNMHERSGLLDKVRQSTVTLAQAEQIILEEMRDRGIPKYERKTGKGAILAGSSVTFDRTFMIAQMPQLIDYLHYRQVDVSSLNILCRMFKPEVSDLVVKKLMHEALSDIQETIQELKIYKEHLFK